MAERAWQSRYLFTFDHHADRLLAFFRQVIEARGKRSGRGGGAGCAAPRLEGALEGRW